MRINMTHFQQIKWKLATTLHSQRHSRRWNENRTAASKGSGWQIIVQDNDVLSHRFILLSCDVDSFLSCITISHNIILDTYLSSSSETEKQLQVDKPVTRLAAL
jgi:hypothetical protein